MKTDGVNLSKISRPILGGIVSRLRVYDELDLCLQNQVVWVSGPPGSGKTALMASYVVTRGFPCVWYKMDSGDADPATFFFCLGQAFQKFLPPGSNPLPVLSPEYLQGLDTFASRFFQRLLASEGPPRVVVIDNYHELPHNAVVHLLLSSALASLPSGISFVVISRELPPPKYARLRANNKLAILKSDLLKLTVDEARLMLSSMAPELPADLAILFHRQGSQFTSPRHTKVLEMAGILISMDGKGRAIATTSESD